MNNGTPQNPQGVAWDPATAGPPTKPTTAPTATLRLQRRFTPPPALDKIAPPVIELTRVPSMGMGRAW